VLFAVSVWAACGGSPAPSAAESRDRAGNPGDSPGPGNSQAPSTSTAPVGSSAPEPGDRVMEGNPTATLGPSTGSGAAGGASGAVNGGPMNGDPVTAAEPTDCIIPTPSSTPIGYGAATTGGGNASPVLVASFEEAQAALGAYRDAFKDGTQQALVVRYTGHFDYGTITDVCAQHTKDAQTLDIKEMENVTFEGAPGSSANFGLHINRAKNVIVRNMTLGLLPGADASDAISIEGNGTNGDVENVWIDHNELFSSTKDDCDGAGDTEFDGLIDVKKGARRITISYNYLHDHQKTGLIGSSDSDDTERYITFHHNRYENVVSRTPLQRFGFIHLFNNYYGKISSSGINVRMGGVALIEANFFENAANPITSRYSDEVGFWDLRDNHVGPGITWTTESDTLAHADSWQSTTSFPAAELAYAYTPDRAECVKQIVLATAGAKLTD
jgi:pectate lyase